MRGVQCILLSLLMSEPFFDQHRYIFGGETVEEGGEMGLLDDLDSLDLSPLPH